MRFAFRRDLRAHPTVRLLLPLVAALVACDAPTTSDAAVPEARVSPRFEPAAEPMDFGAIPFPDDLYLGASGRVALGALPSEAGSISPDFPEAIRQALGDLSGFSTVAPVSSRPFAPPVVK